MTQPTVMYLNIIIVPHPKGNEVMKYAKSLNARSVTILLGHGTIDNRFLKWLAIEENVKDVLLILFYRNSDRPLQKIARRFEFHRTDRGIGFSIPILNLFGIQEKSETFKEDDMKQYEAVVAIVPKGSGIKVVEAARRSGASGATIVNARGAEVNETAKLFAIEIEPEKEIVLMIVDKNQSQEICRTIIANSGFDQSQHRIVFTQPIHEVVGLFEE